jgi:FkbM family methyltransferase
MYLGHDDNTSIYDICNKSLSKWCDSGIETIIDFGARHGEGLVALADYCAQHETRYIMIEPSPRCWIPIEETRDNVATRRHVESVVLKHAITDVEGTLPMFLFSNDGDQSANFYSTRGGIRGKATIEEVKSLRPESLKCFTNHNGLIPFMKMNIEGAEYGLLENTDLFEWVDVFVAEVHNQHIKGKNIDTFVAGIEQRFDFRTHGNTASKHCFVSARRKPNKAQ